MKELVAEHIAVIESRANDVASIGKKGGIWSSIQDKLQTLGFKRDVKQLRAQWTRMKLNAKTAVGSYTRQKKETGNKGPVEEPHELHFQIKDLVPLEFAEDYTLIDSDTVFDKV